MLAGIFGSFELWFPVYRNFPRAPVLFELTENSFVFLERIFASLLIASLVSMIAFPRAKILSWAAIVLLIFLILLDQTRLQPWVYQYLLILVVFALSEWRAEGETSAYQTLAFLQILLAALYFWSGAQKLNYSFAHETLPLLLVPLQNVFPSFAPPFVLLGIAIALVEIFVGLGLLFRRTRRAAVYLAVITHLIILALLVAKDYNRIVWVWNAALIILVVVSFWKSEVSIKQSFQKNAALKIAKAIVAASVLLPALSFFGLWDMNLSGALYSGNTQIGVVRINENLLGKLPSAAQTVVFQTNSGERMLPLLEWAVAEMNVPVYPEERVFRKIAREVCRAADDKSSIELIIRRRPSILDGRFSLVRLNCSNV